MYRDYFRALELEQQLAELKKIYQEAAKERDELAEELGFYYARQSCLNRNLCAVPDLLDLIERYQTEEAPDPVLGQPDSGKDREIARWQAIADYWRKNYELVTSRIDNGNK
jgi:hypothetical protein